MGTGKYCADHPGGLNEGVYQTQDECEARCTELGSQCVVYTWYAPSEWCVLAASCDVRNGGTWTYVEKIGKFSMTTTNLLVSQRFDVVLRCKMNPAKRSPRPKK